MNSPTESDYKNWLLSLKIKIQGSQQKAVTSVNKELIRLYYSIGKELFAKQQVANWGDKVLQDVSNDLKREFSGLKGFSLTNLKYMRSFYAFYSDRSIGQQPVDQLQKESKSFENELPIFSQQPVDQIPWGHNILIFTKSKSIEEATFYIQKTITNGWSRDTLALQVKSNLYKRLGSAITNFEHTLPEPQSELATQTIKDPYVFDFLSLTEDFKEKDLENQLIEHVSKFLLELGKGFAFLGKQYPVEVADQDYYIDLLFYHTILKCYVVIELKNTKFMPEYAGKLNFYLSVVDDTIKHESDKPSIGILLCRDKNNVEVEFALRGMSQPIGVSEFNLTGVIPDDLKSSLPTIEEIEKGLEK
tara:strand:- start:31700 stop:32779 length:1080 start_codon:yes stop_codon:yes gene_type:complete